MRILEPKQYLPLNGKPVVLHALEALLQYSSWYELVIVCEEMYQPLFIPYKNRADIKFALPGKERQDSVFSGLKQISHESQYVCVHDGARPLLLKQDLLSVLEKGKKKGAAALATPVKVTIKETDVNLVVQRTLDRSCLWALQTPQVLKHSFFKQGYQKLLASKQIVTDDTELAELLGEKVTLVPGSESNIKITTSEDFILAELLLKRLYG